MVYLQYWHGWCHKKLLPSQCVLCTPYNHAPCHFMQSHIRKVYACLAVTCHLCFWQNGWGLLRATAVASHPSYKQKALTTTKTNKKLTFLSSLMLLPATAKKKKIKNISECTLNYSSLACKRRHPTQDKKFKHSSYKPCLFS